MKSLKRIVVLSTMLVLGACGAADEPEKVVRAEAETVQHAADSKADSAAWTLRVGKLHVDLDPRVRPRWDRDHIYFVVRGRSSRDLVGVRALQRDGLERSVEQTTPRSFEVLLGDEGMTHVLSGQPLFVELTTVDGVVATARLTIAARFVAQRGFARLYLHESIEPVRVGSELVLRARYQLPEGHLMHQVFTDDDAEIAITHGEAGGALDLTPMGVLLAADRPEDPVYLDTFDGAETYSRSQANVLIDVEAFGLTDGDPHVEWPEPACAPEVADCLLERERGELDTERCGLAPDVDACIGEVVAPPASDPARFAADLRRELWRLYAANDPMTLEDGVPSAQEAVRLVDAALVDYAGHDVEGLERFDPAHVDVWRHRDPISSGRAGHWYGAYDYEGNLLDLWRR